MEAAADKLPIEQIASRWIVASKPDEAIEQIKQYLDLGFTHLVFHGPGHDQSRFLNSFAEQVLPGLRDLI
jgi:coenzyme F420-dependent glucose-6-phosphate dehydrogenase